VSLCRDRGKDRPRQDRRGCGRHARASGRGGARGGHWTVKDGPGGMQDIELLAQAGALIAGATEHWPARN
jgi:glutamine synthetase adenylyltransferase